MFRYWNGKLKSSIKMKRQIKQESITKIGGYDKRLNRKVWFTFTCVFFLFSFIFFFSYVWQFIRFTDWRWSQYLKHSLQPNNTKKKKTNTNTWTIFFFATNTFIQWMKEKLSVLVFKAKKKKSILYSFRRKSKRKIKSILLILNHSINIFIYLFFIFNRK